MNIIKNARILKGSETMLVDIITKNGEIALVRKSCDTLQRFQDEYDAEGRIVLPGLIDCHVHFFAVGQMKRMVDLKGTRSIKDINKRIEKFIETSRQRGDHIEWILGRGWDQDKLAESRFPRKEDLDSVTGTIPSMMVRICGHMAVLNSKAVNVISTLDRFDAKRVPRNKKGGFTGLVKEEALDACWNSIPPPDQNMLKTYLLTAQSEALRFGLAGAHIILSENWQEELSAIMDLDGGGKLMLKLSLFLPISALAMVEQMADKSRKLNGSRFVTLGFKVFSDGSLGARTAALNEPYSDDHSTSGLSYYGADELVEFATKIKRLGMIMATHAIGDKAISDVANAMKVAGIKSSDGFRIEHCSVVNQHMLKRIKGCVVSIQPAFATSDYWIKERLGRNSQARQAHSFRSLMSVAKLVIGGSDAPVESLNPLTGIKSAMNNPVKKERLSLEEAISLYSSNAAGQSPITRKSGRIAKGFCCDLTILNVKKAPKIIHAKVKGIIIDGIIATQH
ncbi:MAG: amidohydrolase [Nitrososphaerales archaeon]